MGGIWLGVVGLVATPLFAHAELEPPSAGEALDPHRLEIAGLPAINYDSDLGLGLGAVLVLAKFDPGVTPYRWRLEALALVALKTEPSGLTIPFHNHSALLDVPGLLDGVLRLNLQASFRRLSTSGWYGFGSESIPRSVSAAELSLDPALSRYHQYERTSPSLRAIARARVHDEPVPIGLSRLEVFGGAEISRSWIALYPKSLLEADRDRARSASTAGDRVLAELLHGTEDHWQLLLLAGLLWDTRDHETVPSRGGLHELSVRASPAVDAGLAYVGFTLSTTWFWTLLDPYLVLATRMIGDVIAGEPPLYALSSFGTLFPTSGPGGSYSTRGVLLDRFHGQIKLLGNLELRARLLFFELFEQRLELGGAIFSDVGRVWADFSGRELDGRPLDGPFFHLQAAFGGGLRFRWGETFLLRAEVGHAPTDRTTSVYVDINQAF